MHSSEYYYHTHYTELHGSYSGTRCDMATLEVWNQLGTPRCPDFPDPCILKSYLTTQVCWSFGVPHLLVLISTCYSVRKICWQGWIWWEWWPICQGFIHQQYLSCCAKQPISQCFWATIHHFSAILLVLIPNNIMVTLWYHLQYILWSKNKRYINRNTKCKTKRCIMCQYMYQCKRHEMYVKNQRNKNYTNYEISPVSENSWGLRDEEAIGELRVGKNNWVTQLLNKIIYLTNLSGHPKITNIAL